jgi:hypothetical protein
MKRTKIPYSESELAFVEQNKTLPIGELHAKFVAEFSRCDVLPLDLKDLRERKGWRTGRNGRFEKGHKGLANLGKKGRTPANSHPIGHELVHKGVALVKALKADGSLGFVQKNRWLWEKLYGPIPPGMSLKCRGDRLNSDPSNWELVSTGMLPRLNGLRGGVCYEDAPNEMQRAIMTVARIEQKLRENQRARSAT